MSAIANSCWPIERADEALAALADAHGLSARKADAGRTRADSSPPLAKQRGAELGEALGPWLEFRAAARGAEIEAAQVEIAELEGLVPRLGPALILVDAPSLAAPALLALDRRGRLLGPDLRRRRVAPAALSALLCEETIAPVRRDCEGLLEAAKVPPRRRERVRDLLIRRRLGGQSIPGIWLLRTPPQATLRRQLTDEGVWRSLAVLLGAHAAHYTLLLAAWWLIGRGILEGRSQPGWLIAWALMLLSLVPLQVAQGWHGGLAALRLGSVLKRRMLAGALALDPDELRERGVGRLLAMVVEAEAVEGLALSSGLRGATALIDLAAAGWVLHQGAGGSVMLAFLGLCVALMLALGWRYALVRRAWTRERLSMTHALVERMVGHSTRLAQESPARWHEREDLSTEAYLGRSRALDRVAVALSVFTRRGWMFVGALGLWPALVGSTSTTTALAVSFGGMLLARSGFANLAGGITELADLSIAWREVGALVHAGGRRPSPPRFFRRRPALARAETTTPYRDGAPSRPLVEVSELGFRYPGREQPVLREVDFELALGDRVLLEGPSGGGKSTFAALVSGLRRPDAGLLLLDGLDAPTHGEQGWRERVAAAPQFHQNHIFTNSFAFNLLMGRRWPPTREDLQLARGLCVELGLGPLLRRMPAGMQQSVGETGWQLSHGERSRVFLARALLQGGELVVLDESFAALDPDSQAQALRCATEHARSLLVIAHP